MNGGTRWVYIESKWCADDWQVRECGGWWEMESGGKQTGKQRGTMTVLLHFYLKHSHEQIL